MSKTAVKKKAPPFIKLPEDATPVPGVSGLFCTPSGDFLTTVWTTKGDVVKTIPHGNAKKLPVRVEGGKSVLSFGEETLDASGLFDATFPEIAAERLRKASEEAEERSRREAELKAEKERREAEEAKRRADQERMWAEEEERRRIRAAEERKAIAELSRKYWESVREFPEVAQTLENLRQRRGALISRFRSQAEEYGWGRVMEIVRQEASVEEQEWRLKERMIESYSKPFGDIQTPIENRAKERLQLEAMKGQRREEVASKGPGAPCDLFRPHRPGEEKECRDWPWLTPGEEAAIREGTPVEAFLGDSE